MSRNNTILYRPEIDSLRAIAVILVILFHSQLPLFPGGFIGVDVFFVISGFLISSIISNQTENNTFSLKKFFLSRVRRIFPALFVMVFLVTIASFVLPLYLPEDFNTFRRSMRSAVLFYSNVFFYLNTGYFDVPALSQVFLHTWSLSVEAQFYVIYPFFLGYICKKWPGHYKRIFLCSLIAALTFAICCANISPNAAFYLFPSRAWELMLGGWLALSKFTPQSQKHKKMFIGTGLFLIFFSAFTYNRFIFPSFPDAWALIPCLGAFLYIAGTDGYQTEGWIKSLFTKSLLVHLGLISYSLYLWHWPVFVTYRRISFSPAMSLLVFFVLCAITLCFAYSSYRFVEQPARTGLAKRAIKTQVILLLCCIVITVSASKSLRKPFNVFTNEYAEKNENARLLFDANSLIGAERKKGRVDFLLMGDSHAEALAGLFDYLGKETNTTGRLFFSPVMINGYRAIEEKNKQQSEKTLRDFIKNDQYRTVFIVNRWTYGIKGYLPSEAQTPGLDVTGFIYDNGVKKLYGAQAIKESLTDSIFFLEDNGVENIYILGPVPECDFHIPHAAYIAATFYGIKDDDALNAKLAVSLEKYRERNREANEVLQAIDKRFDSVTLIDPEPVFCGVGGGTCKVIEEGKSLYVDDDHLSVAGSMKLAPLIKDYMRSQ